VYNKTVPDDDFIKSKHVVIKTQVFLLVMLTDKIKGIYTIPPQDAKIQPDEVDTVFLRNIRIYLQVHTALRTTRPTHKK
jgi:hypothetical protein